jgi:hypothetical protein
MILPQPPSIDDIFGNNSDLADKTRLYGEGPQGTLPISAEELITEPSGNLFGLTQNVGMG